MPRLLLRREPPLERRELDEVRRLVLRIDELRLPKLEELLEELRDPPLDHVPERRRRR